MTCMSHETITSQPETSAISPRTGSWKVHRKLPEGISSWPPGLFSRQKLNDGRGACFRFCSALNWAQFQKAFLKKAKSWHERWARSMLEVSKTVSSSFWWNSSPDLKFNHPFSAEVYSFLKGFNMWRHTFILWPHGAEEWVKIQKVACWISSGASSLEE